MADASSHPHLEKMGRELKCPICLSLLKSAASITCNHVFCNSCILKSMKKDSCCPVCKVPFHRREIRPAPHMDNLVGIYKSMETASGVNIFMSEATPPSQLPEKSAEACINVQNDHQMYSDNHVRSSFPSQKRVQVAQYPLPETPVHSAKIGSKNSECMPVEHQPNVFSAESNPDQSDRQGTCLSPFFWLRDDEDAEDLSQPSEGTFEPNVTPPAAALSFSDMKDSDNDFDSPCKENTQGDSRGIYPAVDLSDNDMLEWTQRPFSPEPRSTSSQFQIKSDQEKQPKVASQEPDTSVKVDHLITVKETRPTTSKKSAIKPSTGCKVGRPLNKQDPVLKPHGNFPNSEENATKKRKKSTTTGKLAQESNISAPAENSRDPADKDVKNKNTSGSCLRSRKRKSDNCLTLRMQRRTLTSKPSKADEKGSCVEAPLISISKSCLRSRKKDKSMKTVSHDSFVGHENIKVDHAKLPEDTCLSSRQRDMSAKVPPKGLFEVEGSPAVLPFTVADDHLISREKLGKYSTVTSGSYEIRSPGKLNNTSVGLSGNTSITLGVPTTNVHKEGNDARNFDKAANNSTMQAKVQSRGSESSLSEITCAFCQSAENSMPYGKIIHYFDGRPVSTNHNEGSDLLHCHQICAEWAPNVYFKNDTAMNLKAELARSKKISCSCCGVKGAALGCYQESCHRSFHVPCAKLMPECRWDSENYVMLCPLHASSKLPCEMPGSQRKRASKDQRMQERVKTTDIPKSDWKVDSHRQSGKIVLCCSALGAVDKDVVAQFKMLSGARESDKWSSSATHVIASVDENDACRRTLKVLMGILEGKWILSVKWIKACVDAKRLVDEEQYEITVDVHGIKGGPRLGRLRVLNKEPKLFHGLEFYLFGDFAAAYKGYLQDLITAGGGTILHRKPAVADQARPSTFIIYNLEMPEKHGLSSSKDSLLNKRVSQANALADSTGAKAASNMWILNSIGACQLQKTE